MSDATAHPLSGISDRDLYSPIGDRKEPRRYLADSIQILVDKFDFYSPSFTEDISPDLHLKLIHWFNQLCSMMILNGEVPSCDVSFIEYDPENEIPREYLINSIGLLYFKKLIHILFQEIPRTIYWHNALNFVCQMFCSMIKDNSKHGIIIDQEQWTIIYEYFSSHYVSDGNVSSDLFEQMNALNDILKQ